MSPNIVVYILLAFLSSSLLENSTAQHDSWSFIKSLDAMKQAMENLQTKIELQADLLSRLVTKAEMQETSFGNLQAKVEELKTLLLNSTVKEEVQLASLGKLEQQSETQVTSLNKVQAGLENQATVLNTLATKEEMQANKLTHLESKMAAVGDGVDMLTMKLRANKAIVEGIIAGTSKGVVIIPLDSREQRIIPSKDDTRGVAFNWQSRKVYWVEQELGIKIADVDGSSSELLIADSSYLCGLAVDQITGNIYYQVQGLDPRIRVCDSRGKKCTNVVSLDNDIPGYNGDIALFPSKGLMFWSSPSDTFTSSVFRANMDGTNASLFIDENLDGLYLDEITERLYWTKCYRRSIGNHNLYGTNRNVLLNTTTYPYDVAVGGDTLYFGGDDPNGVFTVTSTGHVSSFADTTGSVYHIALYGRNKVSSLSNPCKNSPCANLCVLTRHSYTCL